MDQIICINENSFPANSTDEGVTLFTNALQGVLELQAGDDRFFFYLDSNNGGLLDFEIALGFTYCDFIEYIEDQDLKLFLFEVEDKSPALDSLTEEQLNEMVNYDFYMQGCAIDKKPEVYGLAWALSGYLLSINSERRWNDFEIEIHRADEGGRFVEEPLVIKNIAIADHGVYHFQQLNNINIDEIIGQHKVSDSFLSWYGEQAKENQLKIYEKVKLACKREFRGGKPLFESLVNGEGLREIRIPAHTGGAIRIIFRHIEQGEYALLYGFIKKGDAEGYTAAMEQAHTEFLAFKK